MALPKIEKIDVIYMDRWFANVVDVLNFDLGKIEGAVAALAQQLTNVDVAPFAYLRDSLDSLVANINEAFEQIDEMYSELDGRLKAIGG